MKVEAANQNQRIDYLDSVRGIAAMMVVIYHYIGWRWADHIEYKAASIVFNGADAVSFFFVLSGFVLSFKYLHSDRGLDLGYYTYKRILRLYPAFVVTILLNFLYWNRHMLLQGDAIGIVAKFFENPGRLWQELMMVRGQHKYYIPGWTLGVEMALSMLIPVLIFAARKSMQIIKWMLPVSIFLGAYISDYAFHFVLGIVLANAFYFIQSDDFKNHWIYRNRFLLIIPVILMFSLRHLNRMQSFGRLYDDIFNKTLQFNFFHFSGIASALILVWIIRTKSVQRILNKSMLLFLGKISYSIYLCHWLFVVYIMEHWEKLTAYFPSSKVAFFGLMAIYIALTVVAAWLMYRFVEMPFIRIAKKYPKWRTGEIK